MNDRHTPITIQTTVQASLARTWACWTEPLHIMAWNAASDDWHCPAATNDVRAGGTFRATMAARDGSASFDFTGTYEEVVPETKLAYAMPDGRQVTVTFEDTSEGVRVTETFDPETENPLEMQRAGWQAILDRFKKHTEVEAE